MRDAVKILEPHMNNSDSSEGSQDKKRNTVVLATVKGDVHDIGKNITGIVLTCNGFKVHDLGVMVDKETILDEAERVGADIIAVSGLITPSLYQMEQICRAMKEKNMTTPLFVGGATTSALHTAVKLAPLYDHVFHGPDASAAAVMAKKYIIDGDAFEEERHAEQEKIRKMASTPSKTATSETADTSRTIQKTDVACPSDMPLVEIPLDEVIPYFDWKMFYAIWGVKYGSAVPEAVELIQLRRDAEDEIASGDFRIMFSARFFEAYSKDHRIIFKVDGDRAEFPMMRQETGKGLSLCDFVNPEDSDCRSPFGLFAISVRKKTKAHVHGCSCPACSNYYEDMIGRTVRMTVAEAASKWLDEKITPQVGCKVIKPAAGYASCPDHTLKGDILEILKAKEGLGIEVTESYAMTPESSICGLVFMHPEASYPEIRRISQEQYDRYSEARGMSEETAQRFIGHLLK
jgi:5-methyltetrahydrofolate--homocysteine methyltransferase